MKKINLIGWLSRNSHEKQAPQRFGRYAVMLLMLLTLGVGQMWAANSSVKGANIWYYNGGGGDVSWSANSGSPLNLGTVTTLYLKGFQAYVGDDNVCNNTCIYYGFDSGTSLGSYNIADPAKWDVAEKVFENTTGINRNLLTSSGIMPGANILYSKIIAHGRYGDNACAELTSPTYQIKFNYYPDLWAPGNNWGLGNWDNTTAGYKMSCNTTTGVYTKSVANVTQANHEFRISTSGGGLWVNQDNFDASSSRNVYSSGSNGDNIVFQPAMAGTVTITYTGSTHKISIECAAPLITFDKEGGNSGTSSQNTYYNETATSITKPSKTGYTFGGYWTGDDGTGTQIIDANGNWLSSKTNYTNSSGEWIVRANYTLHAKWTANQYTITLNGNGGTGHTSSVKATYNSSTLSTSITIPTKTGYTFGGWYSGSGGSGTLVIDASGNLQSNVAISDVDWTNGSSQWIKTSGVELYAKWTAKTTTISFSQSGTGYSTGGQSDTKTATYDAAMPTTISTPTAANGYAFMGYYDALEPLGTQYYTSAGASARTWDKEDAAVTLYAYFKQAEITGITFTGGAVVAPNTSKTVTAVISPTPTGTTTVCWRVLYSNDNPLDPQPKFSSVSGNSVSFTAPATSGMYKMEAVLHLGSGCSGDELSTYVANFQVAGDHEVTVQYKDASGNVIKASTTATGRPLAWSDDITAPDIFGYTFARWDAGDGVTIKNGESDPVTTSTDETIKIKAVYDGRLTAVYNKDNIIYFVDNLGWTNPENADAHVYLNLLSGAYWDSSQGSGNEGVTNRNLPMDRLPGTTNIFYYNYGNKTITKWVSFTKNSYPNSHAFYEESLDHPAEVVYPTNPTNASTEPSAGQYYGFNAGTPMFVPLSKSEYEGQLWNKSYARYFNRGYWRYYDPTSGDANTGYNLIVYNQTEGTSSRKVLHLVPFTNSGVDGQVFKATVELEAATEYGIKFKRDNDWVYTHTTGHLHRTGDVVETVKEDAENYKAIYLLTTAAGKYDFIITCNGDGKLCIQATFPAAAGDYRVLYTDNATWSNGAHTAQSWVHPSRVISKKANAEDTISFYVAKGNTPQYKIEKITGIDEGTGAITWTQVQGWTDISVDATGVYNFKITQNAAGDGISSVTNIGEYTGNYYIRTDCAGSTKWDNYRAADHMMTYSEYSKTYSDYTHYYMKFVDKDRENGKYKNVKFTIANDYSPCVSDTLVQQAGDITPAHVDDGGVLAANANIRFMWDMRNNKLQRAYLAEGKNDGSEFLVLRANSNTDMSDKDGNALLNSANSGEAGYNHKAPNNCMQFVDNENWIYEANIKIKPGAFVKLYAHFHNADFYFKGVDNSTFDASNAIKLMDGTGDAELVRVIYDFKTDRLVAAWQPSGNIASERAINADVMFVREHQGDIEQLTFTESGKITKITTAYAVLRFNKWTINNKSKEGAHAVLDPLLSRYERDLFYVSFPFRVSMNEVFGFGTYGKHWIIEYYDGEARAANGYWLESGPNWKFVTDRRGKYFEPNQGYIIALELDEMNEESEVWANDVQNVELYFPSYGTMPDITKASVNCTIPEHTCTINRSGGALGPEYDRRVKDSHWNVISVPTYVNTNNPTFANTDWITEGDGQLGPNFLYEWNPDDNSVTARSGIGYTYKAMHAYLVQYCGAITWTSSVSPAAAPRRNPDYRGEYEFRLEMLQNDQVVDQTYVKLSDDEHVTTGFEFNYDMSKEFNKSKSNIYTLICNEQVAGNVQPLTEQTTVIPVGVKIAANGDYTFSMPDGTEGIGITLIDTETGIRTSLSALDYTISLSAGTYDNRFVLEISPVRPISTDLEAVTGDGLQVTGARKIMIDGILYIVKDGKMFDARGNVVK